MTTLNFAPLYRSTVGYDRLFDMLGSSIRHDWPPYNIEKTGEDEYHITMALAGFSKDEIELTQHGTNLVVSGQKKTAESDRTMLHQGIASRNFTHSFSLAEHVKVKSAEMENGLLLIGLVREIPEALKPRTIKIASNKGAGSVEPMRIAQDEMQTKAA
jgi:molecular chaperone IbpA